MRGTWLWISKVKYLAAVFEHGMHFSDVFHDVLHAIQGIYMVICVQLLTKKLPCR